MITNNNTESCSLCPRECGADRTKKTGLCGAGRLPRVAAAMLHRWEEPCISGSGGSGAVFFSGCPLGCIFCQNKKISAGNFGGEITAARLSEIMLELKEKGAQSINLVSPTQYVLQIIEALAPIKTELGIPVVYNTGGYEKPGTVRMLKGLVDIYLPDVKYFSSELSYRLSGAADYFEMAMSALCEMLSQVGKPVFGKDGLLQKGVIMRHLTLPSKREDSIRILEEIAQRFGSESLLLSLMSQYTPPKDRLVYRFLNRRITTFEYERVCEAALKLGFKGYMQGRESAADNYIPDFNLQGVYNDRK